jgi:hypothetical protein
MLENRRGVMEHKHKLVCQHQSDSSFRPCVASSSAGPVFHPTQPQFQPRPLLARQGFSTPLHQVISRPLLLGIRMFRGPKLLKTHRRLIRSAMLVERKVTMPTNAPICAITLLKQLHLHQPLPMEPTLFLLLPSRTMPEEESTMLSWRKPRKLQMLSLVCFLSTPLL